MKYVSIANIGDEVLILHQDQRIGIWLVGDHVPRTPGFISIGSRRYMEWQNLALEATTDTPSEEVEAENPPIPAVERPEYETPRTILQRPRTTLIQHREVEASQDQDISDCLFSDETPSDKSPSDESPSDKRPLDLASVASEESDLSFIADEDPLSRGVVVKEALESLDQATSDIWATDPLEGEPTDKERAGEEGDRDVVENVSLDQPHSKDQDQEISPAECGGSDLPTMMSVQPRTGHATRDPFPLGDECTTSISPKADMDPSPAVEDQPDTSNLDLTWDSDQDYDECVYYHEGSDLYAEDVDGEMAVLPEVPGRFKLQKRSSDFAKRFGRNALPPAARGVVCDIDVGGARPIALKCRRLRIQFREKLADLIKGLLSAKMINYSRSPLASPIVVIIKKNGVDIRLCIDYRLVNSLTQLMIHPMPLINDLLEDLEATLGTYLSGIEWTFGLKNAPQIYQRMIDNALYGFTRIPKYEDHGSMTDVFEDGEPVDPGEPSVLGRRSYIDDIL
ncbi:reverse transcriptase, partial [Phytophthora megakarya]